MKALLIKVKDNFKNLLKKVRYNFKKLEIKATHNFDKKKNRWKKNLFIYRKRFWRLVKSIILDLFSEIIYFWQYLERLEKTMLFIYWRSIITMTVFLVGYYLIIAKLSVKFPKETIFIALISLICFTFHFINFLITDKKILTKKYRYFVHSILILIFIIFYRSGIDTFEYILEIIINTLENPVFNLIIGAVLFRVIDVVITNLFDIRGSSKLPLLHAIIAILTLCFTYSIVEVVFVDLFSHFDIEKNTVLEYITSTLLIPLLYFVSVIIGWIICLLFKSYIITSEYVHFRTDFRFQHFLMILIIISGPIFAQIFISIFELLVPLEAIQVKEYYDYYSILKNMVLLCNTVIGYAVISYIILFLGRHLLKNPKGVKF